MGKCTLTTDNNDNILIGRGGGDTVSYADAAGGVSVSLGIAGPQAVGGGARTDTLTGIEHLTGSSFGDTLIGDGLDNVLDGGAGADMLIGGRGNDTYRVGNSGDVVVENAGEGIDTVYASASHTLGTNIENLIILDSAVTGVDTLVGGLGDDTYSVDDAGDIVIENAGEGVDAIYTSVDYTLSANVENLVTFGATTTGVGNSRANTLISNGLNNVLIGGAGADALIGGRGDNTYSVDNIGDVVIENAGEGTDATYTSVDYTLDANIENLVMFGSVVTGVGNSSANTLIGNDLANVLDGKVGADVLIGGAGADRLVFQ